MFEYDLVNKTVTIECNLKPTEVASDEAPWLWGKNNKYCSETTGEEEVDAEKIGKWMLFRGKKGVDAAWQKVKKGIEMGDLWHAKVSTRKSNAGHVVIVYTRDHTDLDDVIRVLDYLETSGLSGGHETIRYKTDQQTYAGVYRGGKDKPWIFSSDTVRSLKNKDNSKSKQTTLQLWLQQSKS